MTEPERFLVAKLTVLRSVIRLLQALSRDTSPDVLALVAELKRLERRTREQVNEILDE